MYKRKTRVESRFENNNKIVGETIENKVHRIVNNKEPIKDGAPLIYTEKSEGVKAGYNIRTDRFEVALDAINVIEKSKAAKNTEKGKVIDINEVKPIQGTDN